MRSGFGRPPADGSSCSCSPPFPCRVGRVGWDVDGCVGRMSVRGTV
jgi:hypothetical protein